ncbi:hypothetical protein [Pseudodonghicola xiamenensis]|uniref:4Fe-4S ferredoxin-type domain-containing protein n=1 Tax=Pseudodonghicola xiamenensis TaxID=337702 RepID=A0A8J3HAV8_9RHOB|nr:hypothetical protein [Pseudodonghicola xiamenensis]GHG96712.1 hypothetical protein GCM10010961_31160 [Pseudodonghicola xiamenensis]
MTAPYDAIRQATEAAGMIVMGALDVAASGAKGLSGGTLILLGAGPGFWNILTAAPEWVDGTPDPIDRWSTRVVGGLSDRFGAVAYYPFGGPPYAPFIDWAQKSGRAFSSPTGMLVHDQVGMMISYRGALHFADAMAFPAPQALSPCESCSGKPCLSACPVGALGPDHPYDVPRCHAFLDRAAGKSCMMEGCAVRRACPVSRGANRAPAQSAHHMRSFHR